MDDIAGIIVTIVIAVIGWTMKAKENQKDKKSDNQKSALREFLQGTGDINIPSLKTGDAKAVIKNVVKVIGKEALNVDFFPEDKKEIYKELDVSYDGEENSTEKVKSLEFIGTADTLYEEGKAVSSTENKNSHYESSISEEHDNFELDLDKAGLLNAIILSEVLAPPKCKRR